MVPRPATSNDAPPRAGGRTACSSPAERHRNISTDLRQPRRPLRNYRAPPASWDIGWVQCKNCYRTAAKSGVHRNFKCFLGEDGMKIVLSLAAAAMVVTYGVGAMAAERPTFEVQGIPISPVQVQLV